jgi:hypothetical protein
MTGIWLSKANDSDILIMDVEGTDSRERGDEQVPPHSMNGRDLRTIRTLNGDLPYFLLQYRKLSL